MLVRTCFLLKLLPARMRAHYMIRRAPTDGLANMRGSFAGGQFEETSTVVPTARDHRSQPGGNKNTHQSMSGRSHSRSHSSVSSSQSASTSISVSTSAKSVSCARDNNTTSKTKKRSERSGRPSLLKNHNNEPVPVRSRHFPACAVPYPSQSFLGGKHARRRRSSYIDAALVITRAYIDLEPGLRLRPEAFHADAPTTQELRVGR